MLKSIGGTGEILAVTIWCDISLRLHLSSHSTSLIDGKYGFFCAFLSVCLVSFKRSVTDIFLLLSTIGGYGSHACTTGDMGTVVGAVGYTKIT